jgi:hypothetical protein
MWPAHALAGCCDRGQVIFTCFGFTLPRLQKYTPSILQTSSSSGPLPSQPTVLCSKVPNAGFASVPHSSNSSNVWGTLYYKTFLDVWCRRRQLTLCRIQVSTFSACVYTLNLQPPSITASTPLTKWMVARVSNRCGYLGS